MAAFVENIAHVIAMLLLLGCSAFLSGSETAFFNLPRRQIKIFEASANKLQKLAAKLLNNPRNLLTSLLFGNMVVNVLFFALASVLSIKVAKQIGPAAGVITAVLAFFVLLLFGEMLPKSLAYSHSGQFCIAAAPAGFICTRILAPALRIFDFALVTPLLHLLAVPGESSGFANTVTTDQFKTLIEASRQRGLISSHENRLFAEVIELGFIKVRHVMRPRVDMIACEITASADKAIQLMTQNSLTKIPVYAKQLDNIVGFLHQRNLLLAPDTPIAKLVKKVNFVPEQKTVDSLLEFFRKSKTDMAIVVDEYGGIAGAVSVEDIVEELIGPIESAGPIEPIEQTGPGRYRLAADIAIHDWAQTFGIDLAQTRLATVGGLVTALLGRIPKPGDKAYMSNLKFTVENVRKHRIETLILELEHVSPKNSMPKKR
ncbi:MAG: hemolysin family protein [Planctomycetota bacterium]|jgi:CBS domain containing-hemolysin-like protein